MKIAIFYDDLSYNAGGGEKFVALLAKGLKKRGIETDIITFGVSEKVKKIINNEASIITIYSGNLKFRGDTNIVKEYLFSKIDLRDKYHFFIFVGYSCLSAAKIHHPNLFYCLFPPKQSKIKHVKIEGNILEKVWGIGFNFKNKFIIKPVPRIISSNINKIRFLSSNSFKKEYFRFLKYKDNYGEDLVYIDKVISISEHIQKKIKKFYKRNSNVIYPFIETEKYTYKKNKNYWISINRIHQPKRIEIQLKVFSKIPKDNLYIIGDIQDKSYYEKLKKIKPKNVHFLGVINENELIKKLSECKGLIFTAKDEDFGLVPVEAMASGKPVIAPNEGGCRETIIDGKTGILIDDIENNIDKVINAIKVIEKNPEKYKNNCLKQAKKFNENKFISEIIKEINHSLDA